MSARQEHDGNESELDGGPGLQYMSFVVMEDLLDKLKLLNYDESFVRDLKMKSLHRHYFASKTNPGEQFHLFASLSAWLIRKAGRSIDAPQEYDDPNATISTILDHVRQLEIPVEFYPNKLKTGFGESVIYVLDKLTDAALKQSGFSWKSPVYPTEKNEGETEIEDEAELTLDKVEEDMLDYDENDDEDDDNVLNLNDLKELNFKNNDLQRPNEILQSNTTSEEWRLELERVLPQLKVTIKPDSRDWRSHIEQMHEHRSKIDKTLTFTETQLEALHTEISRSFEKISSREKYLNNQLESNLIECRNLQNVAAESREHYRQISGNLMEKSHALANITDELDRIKSEMEERGSTMTDGTPLVSVRKAMTRVKQETIAMDVRIGVVEQKLLMAKLKDKSLLQKDMNAPVYKNMDLGIF